MVYTPKNIEDAQGMIHTAIRASGRTDFNFVNTLIEELLDGVQSHASVVLGRPFSESRNDYAELSAVLDEQKGETATDHLRYALRRAATVASAEVREEAGGDPTPPTLEETIYRIAAERPQVNPAEKSDDWMDNIVDEGWYS